MFVWLDERWHRGRLSRPEGTSSQRDPHEFHDSRGVRAALHVYKAVAIFHATSTRSRVARRTGCLTTARRVI